MKAQRVITEADIPFNREGHRRMLKLLTHLSAHVGIEGCECCADHAPAHPPVKKAETKAKKKAS